MCYIHSKYHLVTPYLDTISKNLQACTYQQYDGRKKELLRFCLKEVEQPNKAEFLNINAVYLLDQ